MGASLQPVRYRIALPVVLFILLAVTLLYASTSKRGLLTNVASSIGRISASAGTLLIVLSFILGPIRAFIHLPPSTLSYRAFFGMMGFLLVSIHGLLFLSLLSSRSFEFQNLLPVTAGVFSLLLFAVLAATSHPLVLDGLGEKTWRSIQRLGYLALALALLHVVFVEEGHYLSAFIGQLVSLLVSLAILLRIYVIFHR